jgi:formiminotetrahydrofolate cyclodeaminase
MIDEDSKNFIPLSKAYSLSSNTEEEKILKAEVMEKSLKLASEVPINLVKVCVEAIKLHERLVDIGSKIAISDVGVGVQCLRSALLSAKLNVIININSMKDSEYVDKVKEEIDELVNEGVKICDEVYAKVELILS